MPLIFLVPAGAAAIDRSQAIAVTCGLVFLVVMVLR